MAEIEVGELGTADRDAFFKDTSTNKVYRRVRDNDVIAMLQLVIEAIESTGVVSQTLLPSASVVVDTIALADFSRAEYVLNFKNLTTNETKGFRFSVQNNGGSLSDSASALLGASIDVDVTAQVNGLNMELSFTNNEAVSVRASFYRTVI